ncbi:MAG: HAD family phosphatase [Oscillospiraceae bacterium]|nr:HAD family phosphatase [Oscillospiraceae bacterium]
MKINGAIFDLDGTLTDSMHVWSTIGSNFIKSCGKTPRDDVDRRFCSMSVFEAVRFLKVEYDLPGDEEKITDDINRTVEDRYIKEVLLKEGVREFLDFLSEKNVPMCLATATDKYMADAALRRLGIRHHFKDILTSKIVGVGKDMPDIYLKAAEILGSDVTKTAVFEDSVVAVRTAKKAGFFVAGLYDFSFDYATEEVKATADVYAEKILALKKYFE